jgi:hypothetical protein
MRPLDAGGSAASDVSPFGVWDMAGSQAEWCQDTFDDRLGEYAIRGNAWALQPIGLETAFRTSGPPDYFHATIGFRLAIDAGVPRVEGHVHEAPPAEKEVRGLEKEARKPEVAPRKRPARAAGERQARRVARVQSSPRRERQQAKPASPARVRPAKKAGVKTATDKHR